MPTDTTHPDSIAAELTASSRAFFGALGARAIWTLLVASPLLIAVAVLAPGSAWLVQTAIVTTAFEAVLAQSPRCVGEHSDRVVVLRLVAVVWLTGALAVAVAVEIGAAGESWLIATGGPFALRWLGRRSGLIGAP